MSRGENNNEVINLSATTIRYIWYLDIAVCLALYLVGAGPYYMFVDKHYFRPAVPMIYEFTYPTRIHLSHMSCTWSHWMLLPTAVIFEEV